MYKRRLRRDSPYMKLHLIEALHVQCYELVMTWPSFLTFEVSELPTQVFSHIVRVIHRPLHIAGYFIDQSDLSCTMCSMNDLFQSRGCPGDCRSGNMKYESIPSERPSLQT